MLSLAAAVALILALPWCVAATAGTVERPHLSADSEVNRARAQIQDGRHYAALAILRPLFAAAAGRADRTDIRFLTGLAAMRAAERPGTEEKDRDALLDEAIAAFRAILVERPGLTRVRLELARAFYLKREDGLAREHFERVLAGDPPAAIAANVRRFIGEMRARRRWTAHFGMALASDSNPGAASEDDTIHISLFGQTLPFRVGEDSGPKPGLGVSAWGGAEYRHPVGERHRLRVGGDFSRAEHGEKAFDRTTLSVHAGPHWLADADTEFALLASVRRHRAAGKLHAQETGLRFEAERRLSRRVMAQARASRHHRVHARDKALHGPVASASLGIAWLATPDLRVDALLGRARERVRSRALVVPRCRPRRRRMKLLHYLQIQNFKRFGDSRRIELDHPAVLIGPNNCGKTTAIQAVALWSQA
ncbi:MAG: surface lipoprotein assembly modifier, partial [Alphaproteobacteria bacterium]|nr:surface lipoprotein assembly modifier [Alphaproteobacteria bacterium]